MKDLPNIPHNVINSGRFYFLDATRAFALILGIFFHGVEFMVSFIPPMAWAVKEHQTSIAVDVFFYFSHAFRMQAFFLVAGFFAHMLYHKYGTRGFMIHRIKRITIPFLLFWPFVYLSTTLLWIWGYQTMGYFGSNPALAKYSFLQIVTGHFTTGGWLKDGFPLTHLWFLYILTWFFISVILIRFLFERVFDKKLGLRMSLDKCLAFLMANWWGCIVLAVFTIPAMWFMKDGAGVDIPNLGLFPKFSSFVVFGFYFGLGWFLHRNQHLLENFKKFWTSNLILSMVFMTIVSLLFFLQFTNAHIHRFMVDPLFSKVFNSIYGLTSMTIVFAFIGFMMVFFANQSKPIRYLSDSSYWLYLIHLPIIVFFQLLVAPLSLHWALKLCLIFIPSFLIMLITYHLLVRRTWIGMMLNGKKY